jgi:hypothetical protein
VFHAAALALYIRPFSPNAGANDRSGPLRKLSKALGAKKLLVPFGRVSSGAMVDVDPGYGFGFCMVKSSISIDGCREGRRVYNVI